MTSLLKKTIVTAAVASGIILATSSSFAWWRGGVYVGPGYYGHPYYHQYYRPYYRPYYYNNYYYGYRPYGCAWIPGHWRHGYWIPAHRAC